MYLSRLKGGGGNIKKKKMCLIDGFQKLQSIFIIVAPFFQK